MKIFHTIWLPFAYWFFPYKLANNALRGTLKHYGINLGLIPNSLTEEISKNTIDYLKFSLKKSSVFNQLYELQILTENNALIMKSIIKNEYKFEYEYTPEVEKIKDIMLKHAVRKLKNM